MAGNLMAEAAPWRYPEQGDLCAAGRMTPYDRQMSGSASRSGRASAGSGVLAASRRFGAVTWC